MNHRAALALIAHTWSSWMQHRSFFFLLAFSWMIPPLVSLFIWSTASGGGKLGGLGRGEFVAYYLALILVNQLTYSQTNWTVGDVIREGGLNPWLLRPMPPIYQTLADEVAGKVVFMAFVLPVAAVLALILHPELHTTPMEILLTLPALTFAWLLRFFWGYWLALLAFWATRADALLAVQDSLVFLFSGVLAPVALLPDGMQTAARLLPFRYMIGFPIEILTGQLDSPELLLNFSIQFGWLVLALLLSRLVWLRGLKHYTAIGG